ncbi:OB-fold nucleic acid binding domain-containing protein [Anoxybacillus flavithermus]|uniref:OB domain-containing protein n=1 Tax=Anoxybacillus flavithermus TaxID=33934 RepID=A0A178T598_9BACL|nr:OB-fold nucleic acid binding domain-containing protein [Anoxybacillus flavithermus]OAO76152.1 hypothetical protein TAF16_2877 [Anoxybacillus flavithermus]
MKSQLKFLIWIVILAFGLTVAGLYKKGYFTKETSEKVQNSTMVKSSAKVETSAKITQTLNIQAIDNSMIGDNVSIIGKITDRRDHKDGHVFLTVQDSSGEILVPIFFDKKINTDNLIVGSQFQFSGKVDEYKGQMEIIPSTQKDIVPVATSTKIEEKDEGKVVTINGKILSKYTHPKGHIFLTVKVDSTGQELDIPLFNTLHPNPDAYLINSEVSIKGKVDIYKGKLELVPNSLNDIVILKKGDETGVNNVKIADITETDRGKMVITKGFVKEVVDKDGHLFFKLSDNGKEIKAVLFKADSQEIEGRRKRILHAEKEQFEIRVLGMVDVYNDELEIIIDKVLVD